MSGELVGIGINSALALITGLYAYFTYKILRANQRVADEMALQRKSLLRPVISIAPEFDEYLVASLVIKNSGVSPAKNVRLAVDKDFYPFAESLHKSMKNYSAFTKPISTLGAGAVIRFDLAQGFNLDKSQDGRILTPLEFTVSADYEDNTDRYEDKFHIDLQPYMNSNKERSRKLDELEKIRKALEQIARK